MRVSGILFIHMPLDVKIYALWIRILPDSGFHNETLSIMMVNVIEGSRLS